MTEVPRPRTRRAPRPSSTPPRPRSRVREESAATPLPSYRVDVVIPVYNEEHVLAQSVGTLRAFLRQRLKPHRWRILIADNASTDATLEIAKQLAAQHPKEVAWLHLDEKGRGRALRLAWTTSDADILSYMDVDLSTELEAFPLLVQSIINGYHIAIGSRLLPESRTTRSPKREFISRCYNLMIKASHFSRISDAQCGFKAISREAAQALVPLVQNQEWFFDTELLLLAEKRGYKIKEIPVRWVEDPDTRVNILKTATEDIRGLLRLRFTPTP